LDLTRPSAFIYQGMLVAANNALLEHYFEHVKSLA
jgi:hypothetical protein